MKTLMKIQKTTVFRELLNALVEREIKRAEAQKKTQKRHRSLVQKPARDIEDRA